MSTRLASPRDPRQDEPPPDGDQCGPCLQVPIPRDPPEQSPSLCPLPPLWGGRPPPSAALGHRAAIMVGPKQAAAGLCRHSHRGGREITEEGKKKKNKIKIKMEIMLKLTRKNRAHHAS